VRREGFDVTHPDGRSTSPTDQVAHVPRRLRMGRTMRPEI
jgi:hypothetical protein